MIFFSFIFLSMVGISIMTVHEDQLLIDPMSITHDPNVRELCWSVVKNDLEPIDKYITFQSGLQSKIRKYGKKRCITENNDYDHTMLLQVLKKENSSKLNLYINFTKFLETPPKVIFVKLIPNGINVIFDVEMTSLQNKHYDCQCLVLFQNDSKTVFSVINLNIQMRTEMIKMDPNTTFKIYYTCCIEKTSTLFSLISGKTNKKENSIKLEPYIKLPFRRFIMASWKRSTPEAKVYNIAIYSMEDKEYCLKIFRIFLIIKFNSTKNGTISKRCGRDTPVEDLGLFHNGTKRLNVILDMVVPLNIYKTYKFSIFWTVNSRDIEENHRYFSPLFNENSGKFNEINDKYISNQKKSFESISQSVSLLSENPISIAQFPFHDPKNLLFDEPIFVESKIGISTNNNFNELAQTRKFHPYFYIQHQKDLSIEIFQIKLNKNNNSNVHNAKLSTNDAEYKLVVSWEIKNSTTVVSPAVYEIRMINTNTSECVAVYFLVCRTCNKKYVHNSKDFVNKNSSGNERLNTFWKEDYYEAMNDYITFTTEMMNHSTNYRADIRGIKEDIFTSTESTEEKEIKESWWSKNKGVVIGIMSSTIIILAILAFLKLSKKDASNEVQSNVYGGQEEHESQS